MTTPNRPPLSPLAQAVVDAHYGAPAMTTPNRPPLWVLLQDVHRSVAGSYFQNRDEVLGPPDCLTRAADIRAVRDWLIQQCRNEGIDQDARNSIYGMLTAEADRAERGDHD